MRPLSLQMPGSASPSLLSAIAEAAASSTEIVGVFAWANRYGLTALFDMEPVRRAAARGKFRLVIGTDTVTDTRALDTARQFARTYPRARLQFVVNEGSSLFHPKFSWFGGSSGVTAIVGSGNLTRGGLHGSWEAFATIALPSSDGLEAALDDWLASISPGPLDPFDPQVVDAVVVNEGSERQLRRRVPRIPVIPDPTALAEAESWLVAELNKSRKNSAGDSMFSQASFNIATFTGFFGYAGSDFELGLIPVNVDGSLGAVEARTGRNKPASANYYFELGAAQGISYPAVGRPIALFGRLEAGGYLYLVRLPGEPGHDELDGILSAVSAPGGLQMRRVVVPTAELLDAWPGSPLSKVPSLAL